MNFIRAGKIQCVLILHCLLLGFSAGPSYAETRYVTDRLILTLRQGPGRQYKVIRNLKTDDPVEALEETEHYIRVQTQDGQDGWVEKQYITSRIPKPLIIADLEKKIERLEKKIEPDEVDTTQSRVNQLERISKNCREELFSTNLKLKQVTAKYEGSIGQSDGVAELENGYKRLQTENDNLKRKIENLEHENAKLIFQRKIWWFLAGAGVFIAGLIAGKIPTRKSYFSKIRLK